MADSIREGVHALPTLPETFCLPVHITATQPWKCKGWSCFSFAVM